MAHVVFWSVLQTLVLSLGSTSKVDSPGALLGLPWDSPLGLSWDSPGTLLRLPWDSPGLSWSSLGLPAGLSWDSLGTPWDSSWLVEVIVSKRILLLSSPDRVGCFPCKDSHYTLIRAMKSLVQNHYHPIWLFCCRNLFFWFSYKDFHQKSHMAGLAFFCLIFVFTVKTNEKTKKMRSLGLVGGLEDLCFWLSYKVFHQKFDWSPTTIKKTVGNMFKQRFISLLLRVPCTPVPQTTASVMPESSKPPNLALKRNATS